MSTQSGLLYNMLQNCFHRIAYTTLNCNFCNVLEPGKDSVRHTLFGSLKKTNENKYFYLQEILLKKSQIGYFTLRSESCVWKSNKNDTFKTV